MHITWCIYCRNATVKLINCFGNRLIGLWRSFLNVKNYLLRCDGKLNIFVMGTHQNTPNSPVIQEMQKWAASCAIISCIPSMVRLNEKQFSFPELRRLYKQDGISEMGPHDVIPWWDSRRMSSARVTSVRQRKLASVVEMLPLGLQSWDTSSLFLQLCRDIAQACWSRQHPVTWLGHSEELLRILHLHLSCFWVWFFLKFVFTKRALCLVQLHIAKGLCQVVLG